MAPNAAQISGRHVLINGENGTDEQITELSREDCDLRPLGQTWRFDVADQADHADEPGRTAGCKQPGSGAGNVAAQPVISMPFTVIYRPEDATMRVLSYAPY
jgi:hypothetical protein